MMRRGMLHKELLDCFNLRAGVRQVATLIDDLISRNKMLAIVRVDGELYTRAMIKVRKTINDEPVIMIERPLFRRGYNFETEIAKAIVLSKLVELPGVAVAGQVYTTDEEETRVEKIYTTGARGPTEYLESLFNIRKREKLFGYNVYHKAGIITNPLGKVEVNEQKEKGFIISGILPLLIIGLIGLIAISDSPHGNEVFSRLFSWILHCLSLYAQEYMSNWFVGAQDNVPTLAIAALLPIVAFQKKLTKNDEFLTQIGKALFVLEENKNDPDLTAAIKKDPILYWAYVVKCTLPKIRLTKEDPRFISYLLRRKIAFSLAVVYSNSSKDLIKEISGLSFYTITRRLKQFDIIQYPYELLHKEYLKNRFDELNDGQLKANMLEEAFKLFGRKAGKELVSATKIAGCIVRKFIAETGVLSDRMMLLKRCAEYRRHIVLFNKTFNMQGSLKPAWEVFCKRKEHECVADISFKQFYTLVDKLRRGGLLPENNEPVIPLTKGELEAMAGKALSLMKKYRHLCLLKGTKKLLRWYVEKLINNGCADEARVVIMVAEKKGIDLAPAMIAPHRRMYDRAKTNEEKVRIYELAARVEETDLFDHPEKLEWYVSLHSLDDRVTVRRLFIEYRKMPNLEDRIKAHIENNRIWHESQGCEGVALMVDAGDIQYSDDDKFHVVKVWPELDEKNNVTIYYDNRNIYVSVLFERPHLEPRAEIWGGVEGGKEWTAISMRRVNVNVESTFFEFGGSIPKGMKELTFRFYQEGSKDPMWFNNHGGSNILVKVITEMDLIHEYVAELIYAGFEQSTHVKKELITLTSFGQAQDILDHTPVVRREDVITDDMKIGNLYWGIKGEEKINDVLKHRCIDCSETGEYLYGIEGAIIDAALYSKPTTGIIFEISNISSAKYGMRGCPCNSESTMKFNKAFMYLIDRAWLVRRTSNKGSNDRQVGFIEITLPGMKSDIEMRMAEHQCWSTKVRAAKDSLDGSMHHIASLMDSSFLSVLEFKALDCDLLPPILKKNIPGSLLVKLIKLMKIYGDLVELPVWLMRGGKVKNIFKAVNRYSYELSDVVLEIRKTRRAIGKSTEIKEEIRRFLNVDGGPLSEIIRFGDKVIDALDSIKDEGNGKDKFDTKPTHDPRAQGSCNIYLMIFISLFIAVLGWANAAVDIPNQPEEIVGGIIFVSIMFGVLSLIVGNACIYFMRLHMSRGERRTPSILAYIITSVVIVIGWRIAVNKIPYMVNANAQREQQVWIDERVVEEVDRLQSENWRERRIAIKQIRQLGDPALQAIADEFVRIILLGEEYNSNEAAEKYLQTVYSVGPDMIPSLMNYLQEGNPRVGIFVIKYLNRINKRSELIHSSLIKAINVNYLEPKNRLLKNKDEEAIRLDFTMEVARAAVRQRLYVKNTVGAFSEFLFDGNDEVVIGMVEVLKGMGTQAKDSKDSLVMLVATTRNRKVLPMAFEALSEIVPEEIVVLNGNGKVELDALIERWFVSDEYQRGVISYGLDYYGKDEQVITYLMDELDSAFEVSDYEVVEKKLLPYLKELDSKSARRYERSVWREVKWPQIKQKYGKVFLFGFLPLFSVVISLFVFILVRRKRKWSSDSEQDLHWAKAANDLPKDFDERKEAVVQEVLNHTEKITDASTRKNIIAMIEKCQVIIGGVEKRIPRGLIKQDISKVIKVLKKMKKYSFRTGNTPNLYCVVIDDDKRFKNPVLSFDTTNIAPHKSFLKFLNQVNMLRGLFHEAWKSAYPKNKDVLNEFLAEVCIYSYWIKDKTRITNIEYARPYLILPQLQEKYEMVHGSEIEGLLGMQDLFSIFKKLKIFQRTIGKGKVKEGEHVEFCGKKITLDRGYFVDIPSMRKRVDDMELVLEAPRPLVSKGLDFRKRFELVIKRKRVHVAVKDFVLTEQEVVRVEVKLKRIMNSILDRFKRDRFTVLLERDLLGMIDNFMQEISDIGKEKVKDASAEDAVAEIIEINVNGDVKKKDKKEVRKQLKALMESFEHEDIIDAFRIYYSVDAIDNIISKFFVIKKLIPEWNRRKDADLMGRTRLSDSEDECDASGLNDYGAVLSDASESVADKGDAREEDVDDDDRSSGEDDGDADDLKEDFDHFNEDLDMDLPALRNFIKGVQADSEEKKLGNAIDKIMQFELMMAFGQVELAKQGKKDTRVAYFDRKSGPQYNISLFQWQCLLRGQVVSGKRATEDDIISLWGFIQEHEKAHSEEKDDQIVFMSQFQRVKKEMGKPLPTRSIIAARKSRVKVNSSLIKFTKDKQVLIKGFGGKDEYTIIEMSDIFFEMIRIRPRFSAKIKYKAGVRTSLGGQIDLHEKEGVTLFNKKTMDRLTIQVQEIGEVDKKAIVKISYSEHCVLLDPNEIGEKWSDGKLVDFEIWKYLHCKLDQIIRKRERKFKETLIHKEGVVFSAEMRALNGGDKIERGEIKDWHSGMGDKLVIKGFGGERSDIEIEAESMKAVFQGVIKVRMRMIFPENVKFFGSFGRKKEGTEINLNTNKYFSFVNVLGERVAVYLHETNNNMNKAHFKIAVPSKYQIEYSSGRSSSSLNTESDGLGFLGNFSEFMVWLAGQGIERGVITLKPIEAFNQENVDGMPDIEIMEKTVRHYVGHFPNAPPYDIFPEVGIFAHETENEFQIIYTPEALRLILKQYVHNDPLSIKLGDVIEVIEIHEAQEATTGSHSGSMQFIEDFFPQETQGLLDALGFTSASMVNCDKYAPKGIIGERLDIPFQDSIENIIFYQELYRIVEMSSRPRTVWNLFNSDNDPHGDCANIISSRIRGRKRLLHSPQQVFNSISCNNNAGLSKAFLAMVLVMGFSLLGVENVLDWLSTSFVVTEGDLQQLFEMAGIIGVAGVGELIPIGDSLEMEEIFDIVGRRRQEIKNGREDQGSLEDNAINEILECSTLLFNSYGEKEVLTFFVEEYLNSDNSFDTNMWAWILHSVIWDDSDTYELYFDILNSLAKKNNSETYEFLEEEPENDFAVHAIKPFENLSSLKRFLDRDYEFSVIYCPSPNGQMFDREFHFVLLNREGKLYVSIIDGNEDINDLKMGFVDSYSYDLACQIGIIGGDGVLLIVEGLNFSSLNAHRLIPFTGFEIVGHTHPRDIDNLFSADDSEIKLKWYTSLISDPLDLDQMKREDQAFLEEEAEKPFDPKTYKGLNFDGIAPVLRRYSYLIGNGSEWLNDLLFERHELAVRLKKHSTDMLKTVVKKSQDFRADGRVGIAGHIDHRRSGRIYIGWLASVIDEIRWHASEIYMVLTGLLVWITTADIIYSMRGRIYSIGLDLYNKLYVFVDTAVMDSIFIKGGIVLATLLASFYFIARIFDTRESAFMVGKRIDVDLEFAKPVDGFTSKGDLYSEEKSYRLIYKAGAGFGATVWKAEVLDELNHPTGEFRAVKMFTMSNPIKRILRDVVNFIAVQSSFPYKHNLEAVRHIAFVRNIFGNLASRLTGINVAHADGVFKFNGVCGMIMEWVDIKEPSYDSKPYEVERIFEAQKKLKVLAEEGGFYDAQGQFAYGWDINYFTIQNIAISDNGELYLVDIEPAFFMILPVFSSHRYAMAKAWKKGYFTPFAHVEVEEVRAFISSMIREEKISSDQEEYLFEMVDYIEIYQEYFESSLLNVLGRLLNSIRNKKRKRNGLAPKIIAWEVKGANIERLLDKELISEETADWFMGNGNLIYYMYLIISWIPVLNKYAGRRDYRVYVKRLLFKEWRIESWKKYVQGVKARFKEHQQDILLKDARKRLRQGKIDRSEFDELKDVTEDNGINRFVKAMLIIYVRSNVKYLILYPIAIFLGLIFGNRVLLLSIIALETVCISFRIIVYLWFAYKGFMTKEEIPLRGKILLVGLFPIFLLMMLIPKIGNAIGLTLSGLGTLPIKFKTIIKFKFFAVLTKIRNSIPGVGSKDGFFDYLAIKHVQDAGMRFVSLSKDSNSELMLDKNIWRNKQVLLFWVITLLGAVSEEIFFRDMMYDYFMGHAPPTLSGLLLFIFFSVFVFSFLHYLIYWGIRIGCKVFGIKFNIKKETLLDQIWRLPLSFIFCGAYFIPYIHSHIILHLGYDIFALLNGWKLMSLGSGAVRKPSQNNLNVNDDVLAKQIRLAISACDLQQVVTDDIFRILAKQGTGCTYEEVKAVISKKWPEILQREMGQAIVSLEDNLEQDEVHKIISKEQLENIDYKLTEEQFKSLLRLRDSGNWSAVEAIWHKNYGLAIVFTRDKFEGSSDYEAWESIFQMAVDKALLNAASKYPDNGSEFSTYAYACMNNAWTNAIKWVLRRKKVYIGFESQLRGETFDLRHDGSFEDWVSWANTNKYSKGSARKEVSVSLFETIMDAEGVKLFHKLSVMVCLFPEVMRLISSRLKKLGRPVSDIKIMRWKLRFETDEQVQIKTHLKTPQAVNYRKQKMMKLLIENNIISDIRVLIGGAELTDVKILQEEKEVELFARNKNKLNSHVFDMSLLGMFNKGSASSSYTRFKT